MQTIFIFVNPVTYVLNCDITMSGGVNILNIDMKLQNVLLALSVLTSLKIKQIEVLL